MHPHSSGLSRIQGLSRLKVRLRRSVVSCLHRGVPFPHVLITGLGGCGKSTVASAIAEELGYYFVRVEGAAFKSRTDLISRLIESSHEADTAGRTLFFFIDEAHRLNTQMQECLYFPMEESLVTTSTGTIKFSPFTLSAATTRVDLLDQGSLVTRFKRGITVNIGRYEDYEIHEILISLFKKMGLGYEPAVIEELSKRCLGIPRNARNLAEKVRDQLIWRGGEVIRVSDCEEVFNLEEIDSIGLSPDHISLLKILKEANGVPRGRGLLAAKLGVSESTLEDTIEPILLSLGFLDHTSRGRVLTKAGRDHLEKFFQVLS